jgi:TolB-like protein/Flp pilus assembly protein TadD
MGEESPKTASEPKGAVFLSYASQDAEAAARICHALRAAGIQVFLDQSELRGGDVWDQKIRREIRECALFVPVISANTASRHEGYFRLEWDLADQRSHMMARSRVFVVPVCLDATTEAAADVPESFRRAQWTRLPAGEAPPAFVERVRGLLSPEPPTTSRSPASAASLVSAAPAAFAPPPHSIAVLPFVNLSGDKEQEYFSDGLTEELLHSLIQINDLQVAARASSFSFKERPNIVTVGHQLNVAAVLEGSVRRSAHTVRVTAQLINAVTGFHLWSKTYDRDLGDVLKLQTEIATAVASALKITLLGNEAAKIELGGTRNPAAFDAYLRGSKAVRSGQGTSSYQNAIAEYTEAIRLDPNYALAFAGRSLALSNYAGEFASGTGIRDFYSKAETDARQALRLAPELAEGHSALGRFLAASPLDYTHASEAHERAMALAPGDAEVLANSGLFAVSMGRFDVGLAAARHAVTLDPLNPQSHEVLGEALFWARRYQEAVAAFGEVIRLEPDFKRAYGFRGVAYYWLGDLQSARSSCETKPDHWSSMWCLALTYEKLGRHADAEAELTKLQATFGDNSAYQCATIYAVCGNTAKALEWLDRAVRLPDAGVVYVKTDALMDSLRQEPRFQAVMRELKFPD